MTLNITPLSQRDQRWAAQRLGTVDGSTIGGYGCLITCMSMLATYYGHNIFPNQMDDWLTDNQGYVQGNLYRNDALSREFTDCTFDRVIFCTAVPAPLSTIDSYLNASRPVVVMVDFDHDKTDGIQTHFVLIVGKDDKGYIMNDPWFGDQIHFKDRYGDEAENINQVNLFSGPVPQVQVPVPVTGYSTHQALIDIYKGLIGQDPSDDEIKAREEQLANGKNMIDVIKDICSGDGRFLDLWIKPYTAEIEAKLQSATGQIDTFSDTINKLSSEFEDIKQMNSTLTTANKTLTDQLKVAEANGYSPDLIRSQIKSILYGKGFFWAKYWQIKDLIPNT